MNRIVSHNAAFIPFTCGLSNFGDLGRGSMEARTMGSCIPLFLFQVIDFVLNSNRILHLLPSSGDGSQSPSTGK